MHIEIEFLGTVAWQAEQYMSCLDTVQDWSQNNGIECEITWINGRMLVRMPRRSDYLLWMATARMNYSFHNQVEDPL